MKKIIQEAIDRGKRFKAEYNLLPAFERRVRIPLSARARKIQTPKTVYSRKREKRETVSDE